MLILGVEFTREEVKKLRKNLKTAFSMAAKDIETDLWKAIKKSKKNK